MAYIKDFETSAFHEDLKIIFFYKIPIIRESGGT